MADKKDTKDSEITGVLTTTQLSAVQRSGEEWADANAAADALEEAKKSVLAKLTLKYSSTARPSAKSATALVSKAEAELMALADPEYLTHIEQMTAARKEANRKRVRYDMGKMWLEYNRAVHATNRAEMSMLSVQTKHP